MWTVVSFPPCDTSAGLACLGGPWHIESRGQPMEEHNKPNFTGKLRIEVSVKLTTTMNTFLLLAVGSWVRVDRPGMR